MNEPGNPQRKQLLIFLGVAFALPFALGIPMGIAYSQGVDISVFPTAQMHYPAAGVMLAALLTKKNDPLLPRRFFILFIAFAALQAAFALFSVLFPGQSWSMISSYSIMAASLLFLILLITQKKEKRLAYGLNGGRWGATAAIALLFAALLIGRQMILSFINGVLFVWVLLSKYYRDRNLRLPTMEERVEWCGAIEDEWQA